MNAIELGASWYELFSRHAGDLYPGRYTPEFCRGLAEQALEIKALAKQKNSLIVVHNYLYPEFHEIADLVGDSLGLSLKVKEKKPERVDFESVFFMGATAKIIAGDASRVFVSDKPEVLGCSLVFGTNHAWLEEWKRKNPDGILVTYINSDAYTKSISDYISTSRNTDKIIVHAVKSNPGKKILVLPDKFLGYVMKQRALATLRVEGVAVNPNDIEVYDIEHNGNWSCCYVHEEIGSDAADIALMQNPDAELMIHPECGCASSCLMKVQSGEIPHDKAYFLSTEQMVEHARRSSASKLIVATEKGMIYRLRKEMPGKTFEAISENAECRFMKANTLPKLLRSLKEDRMEIVLCDDCCDPRKPYQDERVVHIQRSVAKKAEAGIERMLSIV
ncbi:MAG: quinolinate synthase NadA [Patescibacteria group bacterium]